MMRKMVEENGRDQDSHRKRRFTAMVVVSFAVCALFARFTESFHDEIDGPVMHVQTPPIGEHSNLCAPVHLAFFSEASGQGLSDRAPRRRRSPWAR